MATMKAVQIAGICVLALLGFHVNASQAEGLHGDRQHCVSLVKIRHTEVLDGQTILFHMNGRKTLVNHLPRKCPGLKFHKAFSYKTSIGKLCKTDIIRVYEGDYFGAACGLGWFEPYEKPEEDTETQAAST